MEYYNRYNYLFCVTLFNVFSCLVAAISLQKNFLKFCIHKITRQIVFEIRLHDFDVQMRESEDCRIYLKRGPKFVVQMHKHA